MQRAADMTQSAKPKGLLMQEAARTGARVVPITPAERDARVRLAACYRVFDYLGWTESIFKPCHRCPWKRAG